MKKAVVKKVNKKNSSSWTTVGLVVIGLLLMLALIININKSQDTRSDAKGGKSSNPIKIANPFKTVGKTECQKGQVLKKVGNKSVCEDDVPAPVIDAKKDGNRPTAKPTTRYMYR